MDVPCISSEVVKFPTRVLVTSIPFSASTSAARRKTMYNSICGVPPIPLTNRSTLSPAAKGMSSRMGPRRRSTMASAGSSLMRARPGSPWMPIPISISSSASVKLPSPA